VSEVDVSGRLLRSFTHIWMPWHLSVDSEGRMLVADYFNDRILLLNSQLQLQCVLIDNTHSQLFKLRLLTWLAYVTMNSRHDCTL